MEGSASVWSSIRHCHADPAIIGRKQDDPVQSKGKIRLNKTGIINDPIDQAYSPASSDHYFHLKFIFLCKIFKSGDRRTDSEYGSTEWINLNITTRSPQTTQLLLRTVLSIFILHILHLCVYPSIFRYFQLLWCWTNGSLIFGVFCNFQEYLTECVDHLKESITILSVEPNETKEEMLMHMKNLSEILEELEDEDEWNRINC